MSYLGGGSGEIDVPVDLSAGGTGADLTAPGANAIFMYDNTDGETVLAAIGANLAYDHATHTLSASGGTVSWSSALAAQTGAVASIVSGITSTAHDAQYRVSLTAAIISQTGGKTIEFHVVYTDETNTVRTLAFFTQSGVGSGVTNPGIYSFNVFAISVKSGTVPVVNSTVIAAPGGTISYNVEGTVERLN